MEGLAHRYETVKARIAAASSGRAVTLIAVSKTHPIDSIETLYRLGHRDFGENYAQELIEKARLAQTLGLNEIRWHFIGHLQSNKVKAILPFRPVIQTVDRESLVKEISKNAGNQKIPVFIEVNIDRETSKSGVMPENVESLLERCHRSQAFQVLGLMCIPDPSRDPNQAFASMVELSRRVGTRTEGQLSMGMSSDFETAIRMGATCVRIGTSIFGNRRT